MSKVKNKAADTEQLTRRRLIDVATRMFARNGFDGVSVRQITAEANANIGAVNYHFGSKDDLIKEVFHSRAKPMNDMRLSLLDEYEREAGTKPLSIETIVGALIRPAVIYASDSSGEGLDSLRLVILARALPRPFISMVMAEEYDIIFQRFINAMTRALPELSYEEVCWRYDFAIGTLLSATNYFDGTSRIKRITNGLCDPADTERVIRELTAFTVGGIMAKRSEPAPAQPAEVHASPAAGVKASAGRTRRLASVK